MDQVVHQREAGQGLGRFYVHSLLADRHLLLTTAKFTEVNGQPHPRSDEWTESSLNTIAGGSPRRRRRVSVPQCDQPYDPP